MAANDFFAIAAHKELRDLDVGQLSPKFAGMVIPCWVNAPRVVTNLMGGREHTTTKTVGDDGKEQISTHFPAEPIERERERQVKLVSILFQRPFEEIENLDDPLLVWLYQKGIELYDQYHEELKNGSGGA